MKPKHRAFISFLAVAYIAVFSIAAAAQIQKSMAEAIIVPGDHALRQADIEAITDFYEWLLEIRFEPEQRKRFQTLMIRDARTRASTAKAVAEIVAGFRKIKAADDAKQETFRRELFRDIIAALRNEDSELNTLLLGLHRDASANKTENDLPDAPSIKAETPVGNTSVADLAGIWSTPSLSGERYRSLVTGQLSDPSGSIIEYQISPNGTIKHVGYLSMTTYSCTTKLFISRTGRISISGSNITFDFAPGKRMYQTCSASASRNDTLPAERKTYPFRIERDKYGLQLCTVEAGGKNFCIRKKGD